MTPARSGAASDTPAPAPALVLLLAIDQLRPDRLSDSQPGGLGRLQREGRVFEEAALEHAFTETCAGMATLLTGSHPAAIGIPGNTYTDPDTLESRYCVRDDAEDAALVGLGRFVGGGPGGGKVRPGRSPRIMKRGTLGDWMKAQRSGARVFTVSGKDRAAITLGGRDADAAYWLELGAEPRFVTSRYYMDSLPEWVSAWTAEKVLAGLPDNWSYLTSTRDAMPEARVDDYPEESPLLGRVEPHPLVEDPPGAAELPSLVRYAAGRVFVSPFADQVTLAFAKDLVVQEQLGKGPTTDLLAVALSATDLVGHFYGPESWESHDALARLDAMLGDFLTFLEERLGAGRIVVAVSADHGVLPLPGWLQETGRSACEIPGGRIDLAPLMGGLQAHLDERFLEGTVPDEPPRWFARASSRLTLARGRASAAGVEAPEVLAAARAFLEAQDGIARVWTRDEILAGTSTEPMAVLYQNSWSPEITGDLALQQQRDCLFDFRGTGTTHGSPWLYDRAVPLILFGPGIEPGRIGGRAATVDIAPTLAALLGLEVPDDLDGRRLDLH
jgi:hypothetical protein